MQTSYGFESFQLGPLLVDAAKVYAGGAAIVFAIALYLFFRFTLLGTAIRACADNHAGALVVGLDVKRLYALTFGLGTACVGAAGTMMVLLIDATPTLGPSYTLLAFVIVITGGLGSMPGALLGGILIGITEAIAGLLFTPSIKSMFAFGILVLVLLFRPQGSRKESGMIGRLTEGASLRAGLLLAPLLAALLAAPLFVNDYLLTVLILILYFAYSGQAWNIMMGFAGQLSLGHAVYLGLGADAAAVLFTQFAVAPWLGLLAAIPIAAACGAIIGFLAFRFGVTGVYFAILTIAFAEFARIGFTIGAMSTPRAACFCRSSNTHTMICGSCAARRPCFITSSSSPPCSPSRSAMFSCTAASAISGWRSVRMNRRRGRPALTPFATRCLL